MNTKYILTLITPIILCVSIFGHNDIKEGYHFTANEGQYDSHVHFYSRLKIGNMFLEKDRFTFDLYSGSELDSLHNLKNAEKNGLDGISRLPKSLKVLQKNFDLVILEGAGSPAEINLQKFDIANMQIAQKANASVLLVSDIDKGGSFASLAGTMTLIEKKYQKLVKGFILNKFRGDIDVLKPGFRKIKQITKIPVLGTIPMIKTNLPEEDSLNVKAKEISWTKNNISKIDKDLDKLANTVKNNIDLKTIEKMIK